MGKFLNQVEQKPKRPCRPGLMYWFMDDVQVAIHWFVQSTCVLTIPTMHLCIHNIIYIYIERERVYAYRIKYCMCIHSWMGAAVLQKNNAATS